MGARALLMTNRFCIPMGARYARPSVSPWMNTDSKSTDIPYRPSKAPGIARCTTLLMIAHGGRLRAGVGAERERCFVIDSDWRYSSMFRRNVQNFLKISYTN